MSPLPDHPLIGTRGTFYGRRDGQDVKVEGLVTAARRTDSVMQTESGDYPGVQFRMKPDDGSRAFWSTTFADIEAGPLAGSTGETNS